MDKISSLKKLKALFDEGVISEEEFNKLAEEDCLEVEEV